MTGEISFTPFAVWGEENFTSIDGDGEVSFTVAGEENFAQKKIKDKKTTNVKSNRDLRKSGGRAGQKR